MAPAFDRSVLGEPEPRVVVSTAEGCALCGLRKALATPTLIVCEDCHAFYCLGCGQHTCPHTLAAYGFGE